MNSLPDVVQPAKAAPPQPRPAEAPKPLAEPKAKPAPAKPAPAAATEAKKVPAKEAKKKPEPAQPKAPSRVWVQVAGGAEKARLPGEFERLKEKAPKLLAGRTAWTTPLRFTNRLLVGPFKTEKEAQAFVNELAKLKLTGFSWTSAAGQEIEKLPAK